MLSTQKIFRMLCDADEDPDLRVYRKSKAVILTFHFPIDETIRISHPMKGHSFGAVQKKIERKDGMRRANGQCMHPRQPTRRRRACALHEMCANPKPAVYGMMCASLEGG